MMTVFVIVVGVEGEGVYYRSSADGSWLVLAVLLVVVMTICVVNVMVLMAKLTRPMRLEMVFLMATFV